MQNIDPYAVTLCFNAVTRIRTGVAAATTQSTNHYTITASYQGRYINPEKIDSCLLYMGRGFKFNSCQHFSSNCHRSWYLY